MSFLFLKNKVNTLIINVLRYFCDASKQGVNQRIAVLYAGTITLPEAGINNKGGTIP